MTDTYVVVAQVSGLGDKNHDAKLAVLDRELDPYKRLDTFVRDDGTGEILVGWEPDSDPFDAETFEAAKPSLEAVRSAIVGAQLVHLNPLRVELRDVAGSKVRHPTAKKAPAKRKDMPTKSATTPANAEPVAEANPVLDEPIPRA